MMRDSRLRMRALTLSLGLLAFSACDYKSSPEKAIEQLSAMGIDFEHYEESLFEAIESNNVHVVTMLLEVGTNVHAQNRDEMTPLMVATALGREDVIPLLVDHGADVNLANRHKITPLLLAALFGSPTIVAGLLDEGASVNASAKGMTALHAAVLDVHKTSYKNVRPTGDPKIRAQVVRILLQRGAVINVVSEEGETPLHCAAEFGYTEAMRLLIKAGANLNALDENDETPLCKAVRKEHIDAVKLLLDSGANVNAGQKELLTMAADHRNWDMVDLLLKAGAQK